MLDGVYTSADDNQISVLIGLDLSAAFDTVDHSLLCDRLQSQFGVTDTALDWLYALTLVTVHNTSRSASTSQTLFGWRSEFHKDRYSAHWATVVLRVLQSGG